MKSQNELLEDELRSMGVTDFNGVGKEHDLDKNDMISSFEAKQRLELIFVKQAT